MSWPVLSTHKKIQLKKLHCHVFTQPPYGSLLSLILSVQISFQGKIFFFPLYMHRKRKGNFSKPAVFLETLAVLTFFFFSTFVSICFLVLLLKWRQQSMVWCPWCSSKEKGWRSMQWDGPASVEAVRFLGPRRMPLRLFCLLACKILILCL